MSELTLIHVKNRSMGYGRAGVDLAAALTKQGVKVWDTLGPTPDGVSVSEAHTPREGDIPPPYPTANVCWVSVPGHANWWYEGQKAAVFTMWEASYLPEAFRENLHEFDQIIVPSYDNVELFSQYHDNVKFVPLGVDATKWKPRTRPPVHGQFRFLIGGSGARKGTDLAHRAFRTVFPKPDTLDPAPTLVMKNPKGEHFYGPGIEVVSGRLTDEEEIDLYASCHAYVQPSRGEGFGLQPLQAMSTGMPTILTNAHGHESFAHLGIPIGWEWADSDYFIYGDAGKWWEPDFEELCEAMWDVYKNYTTHATRARDAALHINNNWTMKQSAEKFAACFDLDAPPVKGNKVHRTVRKLYPVVVDRIYVADIGGVRHVFQPGKKYYEPADVKRILFESGKLDPICLEQSMEGVVDSGLHPMQLGMKEEYAAEHSYCPTCAQRLNTVPTRAEDIYDDMMAQAGSLR